MSQNTKEWTALNTDSYEDGTLPGFSVLSGGTECGLHFQHDHFDKLGIVRVDIIGAAFDCAMQRAYNSNAHDRRCELINMHVLHMGTVQPGDFVLIKSEIVAVENDIVYITSIMLAERRPVFAAQAILSVI